MNARLHPLWTPVGVAEIDPGEGNLNLKAYIAGVLGPKRRAHGMKASKNLVEANSTLLVSNSPASGQVAFVAVSLPSSDGATRVALFSGDSSVGTTAISARLLNTTGASAGVSFEEVLLPGESLYAQSALGVGAFAVIVSTGWF